MSPKHHKFDCLAPHFDYHVLASQTPCCTHGTILPLNGISNSDFIRTYGSQLWNSFFAYIVSRSHSQDAVLVGNIRKMIIFETMRCRWVRLLTQNIVCIYFDLKSSFSGTDTLLRAIFERKKLNNAILHTKSLGRFTLLRDPTDDTGESLVWFFFLSFRFYCRGIWPKTWVFLVTEKVFCFFLSFLLFDVSFLLWFELATHKKKKLIILFSCSREARSFAEIDNPRLNQSVNVSMLQGFVQKRKEWKTK